MSPFADHTRVAYYLSAPGPANVSVYNISGRLVRTLVDERRDAGRHEAQWDGRNDQGFQSAAGIYFIRLHANRKEQTKRVVLIR